MLFVKIIVLSSVILAVNSIYLDLKAGSHRCIGQQLDEEDVATFQVGAASASQSFKEANRHFSLTTFDPDGRKIISENIKMGENPKTYQKVIETRGVYEICIDLNEGSSSARVLVDIDFKSRSGQMKTSDASKRVPADYIPTLEDQLKSAEETLINIGKEIDFARRQEVMLRQAGEKTQFRIQLFSGLSILVLVLTSLFQLIYLRKFFTDKKIL